MTGAVEDDYLCEGLAEEIINALTEIPGLRVIARPRRSPSPAWASMLREAGARLGAGHILEGSVRREGARVRVTGPVDWHERREPLWSERYDRELTDVLALEDEIAAAIAERLRVQLAGEPPRRSPRPINPEAHAAYLEGRYFFARGTPDALMRSRACFERADCARPGIGPCVRLDGGVALVLWFLRRRSSARGVLAEHLARPARARDRRLPRPDARPAGNAPERTGLQLAGSRPRAPARAGAEPRIATCAPPLRHQRSPAPRPQRRGDERSRGDPPGGIRCRSSRDGGWPCSRTWPGGRSARSQKGGT